MSQPTDVYSKLDELNARFGRSIPQNVLKYFLKENNGDIQKCIEGLEKNQWFKRRHTSEIEPVRAVDSYHRSSSQFLSKSQGTVELSSQIQQLGSAHNLSDVRRDYPDIFQPHPPMLPNANSTSPNHSQQRLTNDMPHLQYDIPNPQYRSTNIEPMPVKVPYSSQMSAVTPGYTRQLTQAEKDSILSHQEECVHRAKQERENTVARLERLKREIGTKNEELRTLKRENSKARIPNDDDLQLTQIIIDTLKIDIKDEQEKRKSRNWTCNHCNFINHYKMSWCDSCNETRSNPSYAPISPRLSWQLPGSGQLPGPAQFGNPNEQQGYNNYRYQYGD